MQQRKVNVIGAGFSGLTTAYYLKKNGFDVTVYEQSAKVGGLIQKGQGVYGTYETAANGIMGHKHIIDFLNELGIRFQPSSKLSKKRFIFRGELKRWPLNVFESLHLILKVLINFIILKKHKKSQFTESVGAWAEKNLTSKSVQYLLEPALQGIYAGNIFELSSGLILKPLFTKKSTENKSLYPLVSGSECFYDVLEQIHQKLQALGVEFVFNTQHSSKIIESALSREQICVVCTSAQAAKNLLAPFENQLQSLVQFLKSIELVPVVTATAFFDQRPLEKHQGFGALFPVSEGLKPLGVLMNNIIFDRASQKHSETWIFGGGLNPDILNVTDEKLKNNIRDARVMAFQNTDAIIDFQVTRWPQVLPHFTQKHEMNLKRFKQNDYVILHGNYLNVIGVSKIIVESRKIAENIRNKAVQNILELPQK